MASNKKQVILIASLIVLLVLAFGYIGLGMYASWNQANQLGNAQYGYNQAILSVAQQAATCQQVPLVVGNQTINLVAVECPELIVGLAQQIVANAQQSQQASSEEVQ